MARMKDTAHPDVVSYPDLRALPFESRRPGYARALLHRDRGSRALVLRLQPGGRVPAHRHSSVLDLFIGLEGAIEIGWSGKRMKIQPGGVCRIPPGVRHEVFNPSAGQDAYCVLLHAGPGPFDFVQEDHE